MTFDHMYFRLYQQFSSFTCWATKSESNSYLSPTGLVLLLGLSLVRIGSHTQPPMNVSNEADKIPFHFADCNRVKSIFCFQYMQEKLCKECMHVLAIIKHQIQSQGFVTFELCCFKTQLIQNQY